MFPHRTASYTVFKKNVCYPYILTTHKREKEEKNDVPDWRQYGLKSWPPPQMANLLVSIGGGHITIKDHQIATYCDRAYNSTT